MAMPRKEVAKMEGVYGTMGCYMWCNHTLGGPGASLALALRSSLRLRRCSRSSPRLHKETILMA